MTDKLLATAVKDDLGIDTVTDVTKTAFERNLVLNDSVWNDLLINAALFNFAGVNDPTWRDWQPGGSGTTFQVLKFEKDDEVFFSCQLPHTYKEGTNIRAHVHWTPCDRGNEENGAYVGWKLDYSWCNINDGVFGASATVDMSDTCSGVDDYHEVSAALTELSGTGKKNKFYDHLQIIPI